MKKSKKSSEKPLVSVSTLMRQARKAKPAEAKRLRAQAAEMRKAARAAKGLTMPPAAGGIDRTSPQPWRAKENVQNSLNQPCTQSLDSQIPGQGDMTGFTAPPSDDVVELMALARKKDGADQIAAKLRVMDAKARFVGLNEATKIHTDAAVKRSQQLREQVVAAFLAEYSAHNDVANIAGGVHIVSEFTMKHVIRALHEAGYTVRGKR